MMNNDKSENTNGPRREKLKGFTNWPWWADLTRAMLVEKDVWDQIEIGSRQPPTTLSERELKTKENQMAIGMATRIIKKGVNDDIFNNIINIIDPKEMWEKLRAAYLQVG